MTDEVPLPPTGRPISRRAFLASSMAAAVASACGGDEEDASSSAEAPASADVPADGAEPTATAAPTPTTEPTATPLPAVELAGEPFTLGVASGDPTDSAVILWTRLAPDPLAGGGMPAEDLEVAWEVASDDTFAELVASGSAPALAALGHSVHVDATGLAPDTWYAYRFRIGDYTSPVGRTRTFPAAGASGSLRVGFGSCQNWEAGFYAAHRDATAQALDVFVWLGDYIYEYGPGEFPLEGPSGDVRVHSSAEVTDLDAYRNRYAQYKSDPDLQANHAARPWVVTWDDHEVDNDYAGDISQDDDPADAFRARRAQAYQAWYEHQPVRLDPPDGPDYAIYRSLAWGDLVTLAITDGRQYRSDQPTDGEFIPLPGLADASLPLRTLSPTAQDPATTMLGADQQAWLIDTLTGSSATWKLWGQQVFMHGLSVLPGQDPPLVVTDTWDGYFGNRKELLETLAAGGVENLVVLTGDFHCATVGDVRADPYDLTSPVLATEFMATSISSSFPQAAADAAPLVLATNPQIKFFDARKGWTMLSVDADKVTAEYRGVVDPTDPESGVETLATFTVAAGVPGAVGG
jgi:alkaline phosphatase D